MSTHLASGFARCAEISGGPGALCGVDLAPGRSLLSALPAHSPVAWVRGCDGLVGWGVAARIVLRGPDRFGTAERWVRRVLGRLQVRDEVGLPGSGPVVFGSFAFSDADPSVLLLPKMIMGRRAGTSWLTVIEALPTVPVEVPSPPGMLRYADPDASTWRQAVSVAIRRITAGQLAKVVLARQLDGLAERGVDPRWLATRLAERFPDCWTYLVEGLVGATPELLVRLTGGTVASRVLAGTVTRSALPPPAPSEWPIKDRAEHDFALRSVAEALAGCCTETTVPGEPYVLSLANVAHLASDVTGVACPGVGVFDLLAAMHPTAAVCGTPTGAARHLIEELEARPRGRYAGPVGWLDYRGDGEWGVALRCAQLAAAQPRRFTLFAGCGIVADSDPQAEFAESEAKLSAVRCALAGD